MKIELTGQVTPILMLGESHSLAFKDILFSPTWSNEVFLCRNRFVPKLTAIGYSNGPSLGVTFAETLVNEGILDTSLRPAFLLADPSAAYIASAPLIAPPIVFFGCDTDMVFLIKQISDKYDFELPDDPGYGVDRNKQPIAYRDMLEQVLRIVTPFVNGIALLRAAKFSRLMVHCIPPRNADEDAACCFTSGIITKAPVRAKLVVLANRLLKEQCEKHDIFYIDTWPETTTDGYLTPELALDGIHFNRKAAVISLGKIAEHLFNRTSNTHNPVRYAQLYTQATLYKDTSRTTTEWSDTGLASQLLPLSEIALLSNSLIFRDASQHPHARTDWIGSPMNGRSDVQTADLSKEALSHALTLLSSASGSSLLHFESKVELTATSFRPIEYAGDDYAMQELRSQDYPIGARCALLQLSEGDCIAFETLEGVHLSQESDSGRLYVFDPHRVKYKIRRTGTSSRVIEMALTPRLTGQPFRVVSSGLCYFPADPFQFSTKGMHAQPPFQSDTFSARAKWL